jgi:clumping factor A
MIRFVVGNLYLIDTDPFYYIGKDDNDRDLFISKYTDKNGFSNNYSIKFNGKNYLDINSKSVNIKEIDDSDKTDSSDDQSIYDEIFSKKGSSTMNNSDVSSTLMSHSDTDSRSDSGSNTDSVSNTGSELNSDTSSESSVYTNSDSS